jgi:hypothetical protein
MPEVTTRWRPQTAEENEKRAKVLARSKLAAEIKSGASSAEAPTPEDEFQTQIELRQAELALQAREERGIDGLHAILSTIKKQYADRKDHLSRAVTALRDGADRHLGDYGSATVDAIFQAVLPIANDDISNEDVESEIQRLAALSRVQYEHEREIAAKRLRMRVSSLDGLVKAAHPQDGKGQGHAFTLPLIEPWNESVNGAELLDEICSAISRYIVMPLHSVRTLALWALHTHCLLCEVSQCPSLLGCDGVTV